MPIKLKDYSKIKERKDKSDKDILAFMKKNRIYTTNEIQKFLSINHSSTVRRLKNLKTKGFVELIAERPTTNYKWRKIKDIYDVDEKWLF